MPAEADLINLDGQNLLTEGFTAGKAISEFTAGLRIGRATQDDRQHAFYLDLDDFSGGFAHHQLDIREALGTHWDNAGGVDLRRGRHITLPPLRTVLNVDFQPDEMQLDSAILANAAIGVPSDDASGDDDFYYFGAGDTLYRMNQERDAVTRVVKFVLGTAGAGEFEMAGNAVAPTKITRLFLHRGNDLVRRLYVVMHDANVLGPTSHFAFTANPGAATPTWVEGSRFLWDAIVGPMGSGGLHSIIAQETTFRIMLSQLALSDLADWNIDDPSPLINSALWIPHGIVHFLGVGLAPWGGSGPAVYFIDLGDGKLYALHVTAAFAEPIDLGDFHYLVNGILWQGFVAVTDGWDVWLYSPGGGGQATIRHIGLFSKDGIPPSFREGKYRITGLLDGGEYLYAIAEYSGKASTIGYLMLVFNGTGWSIFHPEVTADVTDAGNSVNPMSAIIDRHPVGIHVAANVQVATSRAIDLVCQVNTDFVADFVQVHSFKLPAIGRIPIDGVDEFHADSGGHSFLTGWLNGGFTDLQGVLHYLKVDLQEALAGTSVKIEYRIDDDETASFTLLGTASARGSTVLQFDATNLAGVQFRTVQFKVTLQRTFDTLLNESPDMGILAGTFNVDSTADWPSSGVIQIGSEIILYSSVPSSTTFVVSDAGPDRGARGTGPFAHLDNAEITVLSRTPELRGLTLIYGKKPPFRQTWLATIDIDKMVEQGLTGSGWTGPATHQKVWDFLESTWNKQTLVKLIIDPLEPTANNLRVQIADINYLLEDNRLASTARGRATITFIEPVKAT